MDEEENDVLIPETGAVFTFGRSRFAENIPSKFWIRNDSVSHVVCGDEHTAVIAASGRLFMMGVNDYGQLGLGHTKTMTKPSCVKVLKPMKVKTATCGRAHTLIATECGKVFGFGYNAESQLGLGDTSIHLEPMELSLPFKSDQLGCGIKKLASGADHSMLLNELGDVYVWGGNSEGQLGMSSVSDVKTPRLLERAVKDIACGYYHSALVTKDGKLLTFGEAEAGKLGFPMDFGRNFRVPQEVSIQESLHSVACGGGHTLALSDEGRVYAFGEGVSGQLGLGNGCVQTYLPTIITGLGNQQIVHIDAGESHSSAISVRVPRFKNLFVSQISCGGCHTMVLARRRIPEDEAKLREQQFTQIESTASINGHSEDRRPPVLPPAAKSKLKIRGQDVALVAPTHLPPIVRPLRAHPADKAQAIDGNDQPLQVKEDEKSEDRDPQIKLSLTAQFNVETGSDARSPGTLIQNTEVGDPCCDSQICEERRKGNEGKKRDLEWDQGIEKVEEIKADTIQPQNDGISVVKQRRQNSRISQMMTGFLRKSFHSRSQDGGIEVPRPKDKVGVSPYTATPGLT
ncbi:unnamed protein product [Darwinula stevensoni]|uniref:RCC1-like domain-containing protein n=1 Tax=Darwinula stevensoni TaxID=69355 RepID=A0A7R9ABW9_9CRUS|nr:unnamed protein product [Darwinula stevensoni]CAG0899268.1 unnamed protein product [Darwinula stevensoni]